MLLCSRIHDRQSYLLDFEEFWKRKMYVQDFGLVTRLAGTNLFRRENSYGVAREGKLHCKEEGKLRIVCQVEGKLQIVVTSEGKFTPKSSRGGKTPNCVVEGKLQIVCQVEGKLQIVWSSGGKTPNFREEGKLLIALWRNYERLGPVTTPDLLAIANLFGRENSYGVARGGKTPL